MCRRNAGSNVEVRTAICPASTAIRYAELMEGLSIARTIECVQPGLATTPGLRVFVDGGPVPPEEWDRIALAAGQRVLARVVPAGGNGDGSKVLRSVLMIGLTALSLGVGGLAGAAIQVGGVAAVDALIPPPSPTQSQTDDMSRTPVLAGARNRINANGPVPVILGMARVTPPLGAQPYTELDESDQFLRVLTIPGYGPLEISELKIGDTPIEEYSDVEIECIQGAADDPAMRLFPSIVSQEAVGVLLKETTGWITRRTEADIDEIGVELTWPQGLVQINADGSRTSRSVDVAGEYKEIGAGSWSSMGDALNVPERTFARSHFAAFGTWLVVIDKRSGRIWTVPPTSASRPPATPADAYLIASVYVSKLDSTLGITDLRDAALTTYDVDHFEPTNTPGPYYVQVAAGKFDPPAGFSQTGRSSSTLRVGQTVRVARGQYDVRLRRTTVDSTDSSIFDEVYWTTLRSITDEDPVALANIAKLAVRIRATDQLQGTLDELNCLVWSIALDWDRTSLTWIERPTSNPASLFRMLLQGPMNRRAVADARLDLPSLQTWHEWCEDNGAEYNGVLSRATTLLQALRDVASVGRASPTMIDGRHGVVQDIARTTPVQLFTPKNSWNFSAQRGYAILPHALKVQFVRGLPTHRLKATPANVEVGDVFKLVFGDDVIASYTATAATVANVTAGLKAAWDASGDRLAGFYDAVDATTHLTLTGNVPSAQYLIEGEATNGGATDDQELTVTQENDPGTWELDEILVYDDGYDATNASVFEVLRLDGVANEDQAWKAGRYFIAQLRLRPETYTLWADVEHIVCSRGDLVRVQHDVPLFGTSSGRVKSRTTSGGNVTTITLDETVTMETGKSYAVRYRQVDLTVLEEDIVTNPGDQTTLTFSTPVPIADAPDVSDLVAFGEAGSETVEMIVRQIETGPELTAKLTLVDAAPGVHTADSGTIPPYDPQITAAPRQEDSQPAAPEIVNLRSGPDVMIRHKDGTFENRILATIRPGAAGAIAAARYQSQFKLADATRWIELPDSPADATDVSVTPVEDAESYDFRIRAISKWGIASPWTTATGHTVIGAMELGTDFLSVYGQALDLASGTMVNAAVSAGVLYAPINATETWATHFSSRSWTSIQDQIDAGYPYYNQPTSTAFGSWELKTDLGGIVYNARVKSIITIDKIDGDVTITPTISVSADDIDYTEFAGSDEITVTGFRYVKIKYEFLASTDLGYVAASEIRLEIDARTRIDSTLVTLVSTDSGGTAITFGLAYLRVAAIVVTPKDATSSYYCVVNYDFATTNPTTFKVMMFDQAGTRVSGDASYVARGY